MLLDIQGEVSSPGLRGGLASLFQLAVVAGLVTMYGAGLGLDWARLGWAAAALPCLTALLCPLCPESPAWLAARGRAEDCRSLS